MLTISTAVPSISASAIAQTVAQRVWPAGASGSAPGFQRAFHSVEMTLLALVAALLDLVLDDLSGTRGLLTLLVPVAVVTIAGHLLAILTSGRLR